MVGGGMAVGAIADKAISGGIAIKEANKSWKRQKRAMQNQVRWRVSDLRAAGLNPILAANLGFGGGGSPTAATPTLPSGNAGEAAASSAKSAAAARKDQRALDVMQSQERLLDQQTRESESRAYQLDQTGVREQAAFDEHIARRDFLRVQSDMMKLGLPRAAREAELWSGKSGETMKLRDASQGWFSGFGLGGRAGIRRGK